MLSLEYLKLSMYLAFRFTAQYFIIFVLRIYFFSWFSFQKQSFVGLLTKSKRWVCGVVSVSKCDFNRVAMQFCWGHTSAWVFYQLALYFQGTSLWKKLHLFFAKALLSLIVHFKGTFTYFITVLFMTNIFLIFSNCYRLFVSAVTFAWAVSII